MADVVLLSSTALLGLALVFILYWLLRKPAGGEAQAPEPAVQAPRARMQVRRGPRRQEAEIEAEDPEGENPEDQLSKKEQLKKQKREERKAQRDQQHAAWEEKERRKQEKFDKYSEREKASEEKYRLEEELALKAAEEKAKKEEEEFAQWKGSFQVSAAGEESANEERSLARFVEYIKLRKVVMIEDLAAEFGLDGKTVQARLESLEKSGMISGVIDDRGKFIYITDHEMEAVKQYIQRKGRVSKAELCRESNRLIRLEPTPEDKQKIQAEERALAASLEGEINA